VTHKNNWSCSFCGMSSSRRFSIERHIGHIHKGKGIAIPFVEYLAGRRQGKYLPQKVPRSVDSYTRILEMVLTEADKDFARKLASRLNPPADDPIYEEVASVLRTYKRDKFLKEIIEELKDGQLNPW
jgi:hypothetical protein